MTEPSWQYLSIKNWSKYQPKLKNGNPRRDWIRLDTNRVDDSEFIHLGCFARGVLTGLMELVGRTGKWPPNDVTYIARAMHTIPTDRPHLRHTIDTLLVRGFLILCSQQNEIESALQDKTRQDKTRQSTIPSAVEPPRKAVAPKPEPVIFFDGIKLKIDQKSHDAFLVAYEGTNLLTEYRRMDAWLVSNKRNYRDFGRFANSWLGKLKIPINGNGQSPTRFQNWDERRSWQLLVEADEQMKREKEENDKRRVSPGIQRVS
jgi:hypothetical protein